ncbi:DNA translocase FtsK [Ruminococcus sp.]|uniref:DNA translocase FtsK n=1 Tax=Ruminococcus sp. TaxID=41978 RepID=UPI003F109266
MSAKKQTASKNKKSKTPAKTQKSRSRAKKPETVVHTGLSPRVRAIIYGAIAVIFALMIIIKGENVWTAVRSFFFGVFGFGIFLIPILMIYLCLMTEKEKQVAHFKAKIIISSFIILLVGALIYIVGGAEFNNVNFFACLGKLYIQSADTSVYMTFGCGLMGGILGYPITLLCGEAAALCLCIVATVMLVFIIANISVKDLTAAASRTVSHVREAGEKHARERKARREAERENQQTGSSEVPVYIANTNVSDGIDIPLDNPKKKKRVHPPKSGIDIDYVDTNEQNAADKDLSEDLINIINRASKPLGEDADTTVADIAEDISQEKASNHMTDGAKQADPETVPVETESKPKKSKTEENSEFDNVGYKADNSSKEVKEEKVYHYPPVQLLKPNTNNNDRNAMEELQNNSKKLIETLQSFGVNATITNICRGPSVTRYELQPAPGVKISKITNLSDDIALNLAANGVRIEAPIPGKAAVGIEVPNKVVSMVSMRELIDSDKFRNAKSKLTTVLGRDISGEIVVTDLAKMPHLLIAGTTGSGKSVCVNSILMSILFKATPDEVKLLLIDPKMVEFSKYKGIPHLLVPVVSDAKKAAGALAWAVNEMLQRYKIFSEYDCKDIDSYNSLIEKNLDYISKNPPVEDENGEMQQPVLEINGLPVAKEKMSRVVIAIDELADLMMAAPSEVEDSICRLAQMARAAGMHLILATQRPTVNVITGLIKANVPSRISLKVSSNMDSRTILDTGGGEKLIGKGDMLFAPVGAPKPMRVQGCYASDEEIEGVTNYIKKSYSAQYNADIEEKIKRIAAEEIATGKKQSDSSSDDDGLDVDSKMDEAIKCVIEAGQASTSLIQRRLKVGYARAGRMIDDMEQLGVVGPHQGSKPRDVLMTYNEWLERRNALQNRED